MFSQPVVAPIGTQWVRLAEGVDVYVAAPEGRAALGGVIVAGEIFGITTHVRDICERPARAGYLVAAPDFYWRQQRRTCLSHGATGRKAGVRMLRLLQREEVVADVAAVRAYLATRLGASKAMAIVGVSAGGHIAFLAATRVRFALAVSIYGGWMVDGGIPLAEPTPPVADCAALAANGCFFSASRPAAAIVSSPPNSGVDSTSCSMQPGSSTNWSAMRVRGTGFSAPNDPRPSMPKRAPTCGGGC